MGSGSGFFCTQGEEGLRKMCEDLPNIFQKFRQRSCDYFFSFANFHRNFRAECSSVTGLFGMIVELSWISLKMCRLYSQK